MSQGAQHTDMRGHGYTNNTSDQASHIKLVHVCFVSAHRSVAKTLPVSNCKDNHKQLQEEED